MADDNQYAKIRYRKHELGNQREVALAELAVAQQQANRGLIEAAQHKVVQFDTELQKVQQEILDAASKGDLSENF